MKKLVSICLAVLLIVSGSISAAADTISELEARQAELEQQQAEYQEKLNSGNAAVEEQQGEVDALVGQIDSVTEEIQICYKKIGLLDKSISKKQVEIDAANDEIEAGMNVLRQRIKTIYISGDVSSLEIVLGAKDFTDFLDKLQLVQYVSNHDEELINEVKVKLDTISEEKASLEADKKDLQEEQKKLESKKSELDTLLEDNKETLSKLQSNVDETKLKLEMNEDELSGLSAEIQEYYRKQREAQERAAAQAAEAAAGTTDDNNETESGGSSETGETGQIESDAPQNIESDGSWTWPTPGSYILTSEYGEGRSYETHNAVDIGASTGTPIYAANSGTVVSSYSGCTHSSAGVGGCDCGGGYGNYVRILHDNGYETIYGHMISTAVSTGDTVSNGQLIGYVGSTGWSTGPHLHFEMHDSSGNNTNPMNFY